MGSITFIKKTLGSRIATEGSSKHEMAERVGFEPTVGGAYAGFQDRYLQPLGHLSSLAYYSMRRSRAKDEGDQLLRKPWILSLSPPPVESKRCSFSPTLIIDGPTPQRLMQTADGPPPQQ